MVSLSLSNKLMDIRSGLLATTFLFFSFSSISQNYFNKRFDFDGAIISINTVAKNNQDYIYATGYGVKNPEVNARQGLFFSKFNNFGEIIQYEYFNNVDYRFTCCLDDNFILENESIIFPKRVTGNIDPQILLLKHKFDLGTTKILANYDNDDFNLNDRYPFPQDIISFGENDYFFSASVNLNDTINSFFIRYKNNLSQIFRFDDFHISHIEQDFQSMIYSAGLTNNCSGKNCGKLYLGKFDVFQNQFIDKKTLDIPYLGTLLDFIVANNNLFVLTNEHSQEVDEFGDLVFRNILLKYNSELELIYKHTFENSSLSTFWFDDFIESHDKKGYVLAGYKNVYPDSSNTSSYGYLAKVDLNFDTVWTRTFNNHDVPSEQQFRNVTRSEDGGYIMGGEVSLMQFLETEQPVQAWLLKVNSYGLFTPEFTSSSEEIVKNYDKVNIYPNPNHGSIILEEIDTPPLKYVITNSSGQEVYRLDSDGGNITHFVDLEVGSGIYFVQIWSDGSLLDTRKIVVQN